MAITTLWATPVAAQMAEEGAALPLDLPWYFALFILGVWLAAVYGIVKIVRYRLRQRADRRERARRLARAGPDDVIDVDSWELGG